MTRDSKEWADWLTADFARGLLRYDEQDGCLLWKGAKDEHGGFIGVGVLRTIYTALIKAAQEDSRE